jgi:hypothetical protein
VGYLKIRQSQLSFENIPNREELSIAASCTSEFLKNKKHLTNFRTPGAKKGIGFFGSPEASIHTSHITSIRTPRTNKYQDSLPSSRADGLSVSGYKANQMSNRLQ